MRYRPTPSPDANASRTKTTRTPRTETPRRRATATDVPVRMGCCSAGSGRSVSAKRSVAIHDDRPSAARSGIRYDPGPTPRPDAPISGIVQGGSRWWDAGGCRRWSTCPIRPAPPLPHIAPSPSTATAVDVDPASPAPPTAGPATVPAGPSTLGHRSQAGGRVHGGGHGAGYVDEGDPDPLRRRRPARRHRPVVYAALWLFVPDDYGRVLIQGGATDRKEAAWAGIFTASPR